jgi:tetratricopeptide (TPR) repeat protein
LGRMPAGTAQFATNVRVPPGSYIVRLAVQDGAGRVGSVDHRVDARAVSLGTLRGVGPMLATAGHGEPHLAVDGVHPDDRLALEINLQGTPDDLADAEVTFEIAATAQSPALVVSPGTLSGGKNSLMAQAVADVRVLPPGEYVARAKVRSGTEELGELRRAFVVLEREHAAIVPARDSMGTVGTAPAAGSAALRGRAASVLPRFAASHVLAPDVLGAYLDRVGSRPDAARPEITELLTRARGSQLTDLQISDAQAAETPVAAFLKGLALLAQQRYNGAATAFRAAMRASPDFYPAMVYLGACYAAAGNDKEASAVWRTALIREGDTAAVHLLLADALLRQGSGEMALQVVDAARARWPEDDRLAHRFVLASLLAGNVGEALRTVDDLVARGASDEPTHALALLVLYDSLTQGRTIESAEADRARMLRLADAYRVRRGPSLALVDMWVQAIKKLR